MRQVDKGVMAMACWAFGASPPYEPALFAVGLLTAPLPGGDGLLDGAGLPVQLTGVFAPATPSPSPVTADTGLTGVFQRAGQPLPNVTWGPASGSPFVAYGWCIGFTNSPSGFLWKEADNFPFPIPVPVGKSLTLDGIFCAVGNDSYFAGGNVH